MWLPFKTEGTSRTWGQSISETGTVENTGATQTTQAAVGGVNVFGVASATTPLSPLSAAPPVRDRSNSPDNSEPPEGVVPVVPVDTVVEIIKNTAVNGVGSNLGCKAISDIAMAAASSNNATAIVSDKEFVASLPRSLQGQILASVSTVVPNTSTKVVVAGSSVNTKDDIKKALTEAQKIDLSITLRSKKSEKVEFNNVKRPVLQADFVYNYFTKDEGDIETQEDQTRDPLLKRRPVDVPRYVSLQWGVTEVTAPLRGTEEVSKKNSKMKQDVFSKPGGSFSTTSTKIPFSAVQQAKNKQPYIRDGVTKSIVDAHKPDVVFSSLSNGQVFPNSVSVTVNTNKQKRIVDRIPSLQLK